MDGAAIALLGAIASALFSAYFIGSFAFVAYVLRKYDSLKDELRAHQVRIDHLASVEGVVLARGAKSLDPEAPFQ